MSYSYTKISTFAECPRKYKLSYIDGIIPKIKKRSLSAGHAIHKALEAFRTTGKFDDAAEALVASIDKEIDDLQPRKEDDPLRSIERLLEILNAYCMKYEDEHTKILQPEVNFELAIFDNPHRLFRGRIDAIIELEDHKPAIFEDKTTTRMGDFFFKQHKNSAQTYWYLWAAWKKGLFSMYDSVAPKCIINGIYIHADKFRFERDMAFRPSVFLEDKEQSILDWILQIEHAIEINNFPHNFGACSNWGGCEYLTIRDLKGDTRDRIIRTEFKDRWNKNESERKDD